MNNYMDRNNVGRNLQRAKGRRKDRFDTNAVARLAGPGGARSVVAESVLVNSPPTGLRMAVQSQKFERIVQIGKSRNLQSLHLDCHDRR
jgi:hypothetical protein